MPLYGDIVVSRKLIRYIAALYILTTPARGQYILGDEAWAMGTDRGFFSPPVTGAVVATPTFDLVAGQTTPNDLSDSLTVNSTSMTLVLACDAQGISGTNWTCRDANGNVTLSEAGTGASPTTTINTPFHALDSAERGVSYLGTGKTHSGATSSVGDIGTDDFIVEWVGRAPNTNASWIDKGIAGTDGWSIGGGLSPNPRLNIRTGSTTTQVNGAASLNQYVHFIAFADRNEASTNGALAYTNGAPGTGVDVSARSGSLGNASLFAVGGASGSASSGASITGSLRVWKCTACFAGGASNPAQWAPIARQRVATAFGIAPAIAAGTAAPTALTRATNAQVDVVDGNVRHLYLVGSNAPRVARRTHSGGTVVAGYMSEPAVSNLALQSQTLGTTWTAITAGDNVLADAFAGADLSVTGDDIDGNNSSGEHGLRQAITVTAATHSFSVWAEAGAQTWVALRNATIANGTAWFDVSTCTSGSCTVGEDCAAAVGTVQAGVIQARAQRYPIDTTGDGAADVNLCRVSISYTGTAAAHNHDLLCASADNTLTYTDADATADCGFWGVRVEAFPTMTSYLATSSASVVRNADDLRFDGASHYTGSPSTMDVAVLCPTFDDVGSGRFLTVGTGTANYGGLLIDQTNDRPNSTGIVTTTQWTISGVSGDVADGIAHALRVNMATNNITAYYDGVSIGTDATATLPTVASSFLYFGSSGGSSPASACLISRARLWSSLVAP